MLILALGFISLGFAGDSRAQEIGRSVVIREATNHDLYAAGQEVEIRATVTGDFVAAGRSVVIAGNVSEDAIAAGRSVTVTVTGNVGDDVRLAGRSVTLAGTVIGHAVIAGRETRIEKGSQIGDWAWIAGRRVNIAGTVGGDLKARGGRLELTGQVDGDVELSGRHIRVGDGAVINGNLTWRSDSEPVISDGAVITGQVVKGSPLRERPRRSGFLYRLFMTISVIVAAGVLYMLFRPHCDACATVLQSRPWASLMTGLAVFATTPVVMLLLFATGIGALLGILLMLAYGLALMIGGLSGVILIARLGLMRFSSDTNSSLWLAWSAIAIVAILMGSLYIIRPLGMLVAMIVMLFGLGVLSLEAYRRFRS
jgi:cytoskeletal protein CcmA (bactofilin family)